MKARAPGDVHLVEARWGFNAHASQAVELTGQGLIALSEALELCLRIHERPFDDSKLIALVLHLVPDTRSL